MSFTDFSGALSVSNNGNAHIGRMTASWDVSGGLSPAGGFELAIQVKDSSANIPGYLYLLDPSTRSKDIRNLPSGNYTAVISARDAAGLLVKSQKADFDITRMLPAGMSLGAVCDASSGDVTVSFNSALLAAGTQGFAGPYIVKCGSASKTVNASSVVFSWVDLGSKENLEGSGAVVTVDTIIDNNSLSLSGAVIINRYVRISNVDVSQSASQAIQGKATVTYATAYGASSTVYDLHMKKGDDSYALKTSNFLSGGEIDTAMGVSSESYLFKIVARNAAAGHIDIDKEAAMASSKILTKQLTFTATPVGSLSGKITVSAADIGATSSVYTFSVSGEVGDNSMSLSNPHVGSIVRGNGTYYIKVKVMNNGEDALSNEVKVIISKASVISDMAVDERMYASLGKIKLTWTHAQSSGACVYEAKLRRAADNFQVDNVPLTVLADAAGGSKTLLLSPPTAGAYVVRLEVTVNDMAPLFFNEVIVYLENAPLNLKPHRAVVVDLGVALDARADAAVLDAATPLVSGNVVTCETTLPASALYANASGGLIEFWEPSDAIGTIKAKFTVNAGGAAEPLVYKGLEHAKNLVLGVHSCLTHDLDCSGAAPFAALDNAAYDQYASVGDMTLGYIAQKLFGHPAATAAITNDAHIKDTMNASPGATVAAVTIGSGSVAAPDLNTSMAAGNQKLALRLVQTMLFAAQAGVDASPAARATRIANSVIGQDADRSHGVDNNELAPDQRLALPFYAGDVLFFKLTLKSLDVFQGRLGNPVYNTLKARLTDQEFTFKITLS